MNQQYKFSDFFPLLGAVLSVVVLSLIFISLFPDVSFSTFDSTRVFMGFFFLVFGGLKAWNTKGFADAFSMYDPFAKRSRRYARVYPSLEILLGVFYLAGIGLLIVNVITFVLMTVGAYGVWQKLQEKEVIPCACMGAVFTIPMTWVTLGEDVLMATMAAVMFISLL